MELSYENYLRELCAFRNKIPGGLSGCECPDCLNRGYTLEARDGEIITKECRCMPVRNSLRLIEKSGLRDLVNRYTFERYNVRDPWQKQILTQAKAFAGNPAGHWFYVGGQSGSGKTHICTAITTELMRQGRPARYMLWRDESVFLKGCINNPEEYQRRIRPFKESEVLYIDDLFKYPGGDPPKTADIGLAFEILNFRYNRRSAVTLISSEWTADDILHFDEALGGRIIQKCGPYCLMVRPSENRNFRLKMNRPLAKGQEF